MKLRNYINNNELEKSDNIDKDSYIVAKKIIMLIKNREYNEAMLVLDKNIEALYRELNLSSFCFLIDYYINNIEEEYLKVLHRECIPSLLINLSNDYDEKNKMYFIKKLNQYKQEKKWIKALQCVEILIEKTDIENIDINKHRLEILINLNRYEEALIKCEELLNINIKNEYLTNTKIEILVQMKQFEQLELLLETNKQDFESNYLADLYMVLAKNYEDKKNYEKSYQFYEKANKLGYTYKIPAKIIYKTKKNKFNLNRLLLFAFIVILLSMPISK